MIGMIGNGRKVWEKDCLAERGKQNDEGVGWRWNGILMQQKQIVPTVNRTRIARGLIQVNELGVYTGNVATISSNNHYTMETRLPLAKCYTCTV